MGCLLWIFWRPWDIKILLFYKKCATNNEILFIDCCHLIFCVTVAYFLCSVSLLFDMSCKAETTMFENNPASFWVCGIAVNKIFGSIWLLRCLPNWELFHFCQISTKLLTQIFVNWHLLDAGPVTPLWHKTFISTMKADGLAHKNAGPSDSTDTVLTIKSIKFLSSY